MIRIANVFNDCRNSTTKKTYLVNLLPAWLLSGDYKASQSCVMTDLSSSGAAVLIPKEQSTLAELIDLVLMSPDNEDEILTILSAEQRWRDEEHSPDHIKIGVVFLEMNAAKSRVIDAMIEVINSKKNLAGPSILNTCFPKPVVALA